MFYYLAFVNAFIFAMLVTARTYHLEGPPGFRFVRSYSRHKL